MEQTTEQELSTSTKKRNVHFPETCTIQNKNKNKNKNKSSNKKDPHNSNKQNEDMPEIPPCIVFFNNHNLQSEARKYKTTTLKDLEKIDLVDKEKGFKICLENIPITTLNYDVKERLKQTSNKLQVVKIQHWHSLQKLDTYNNKGVFMKCFRSLPTTLCIDKLKENNNADNLDWELEVIQQCYQNNGQMIMNCYLQLECKTLFD